LIEVNLQHFQQFQLGLCFERLRDYLSLKMNLYKYIYTPKEWLAEKTEQICYLQTTTEWGGTRGQIVGLIELNLQHFQQFQLGVMF
jgi:hypothetical protein